MRTLSLRLCLILTVIIALSDCLSTVSGAASPAMRSTLIQKDSKKPSSQKGDKSGNLGPEEEPPVKPGRGKRQPKPPKDPLLELEYRVVKLAENGLPGDTNPLATFQKGDRVQLWIKPHHDGYLYL